MPETAAGIQIHSRAEPMRESRRRGGRQVASTGSTALEFRDNHRLFDNAAHSSSKFPSLAAQVSLLRVRRREAFGQHVTADWGT